MKIKKICIVGFGSHIKNTIIPSLNLETKNIKIITKKKINIFETFPNIQVALKKLPKDYIFYNSTPPRFHYSTSKLILLSGFNTIVEKPLCLNIGQLKKLNYIAKKRKLFLFENMMYFYSKQFKFFKKLFDIKKIKEVNINFFIPNLNKNSFRVCNNLNSSILYDMGCYPFSLISYFGIDNKNNKVLYKIKNKKLNFLEVTFLSKKIKFIIKLALFKKYENYIKVMFKDNSFFHLNHFFYGKKINKLNYFLDTNKKIKILKINEDNLFKNIFNYSTQKLLKLSRTQYFIIKRYLISLNRINKRIKL
jgi:hypothetical protein